MSKQIKTTSAQKSPKRFGKSSVKNKSVDKEGLAQAGTKSKSSSKRKGSKRERLRLSVKAGDIINQAKEEGVISLVNLTPAKSKKIAGSLNSISPKTPADIRSLVASTIMISPKVDYNEIAKYNTVELGDQVFLNDSELESVFGSPPPKIVPPNSFKGIYLERKVYSKHVSTLKDVSSDPEEIFTEYYSL